MNPGQNRDIREILRNLIGCLEDWELKKTEKSQQIKNPGFVYRSFSTFRISKKFRISYIFFFSLLNYLYMISIMWKKIFCYIFVNFVNFAKNQVAIAISTTIHALRCIYKKRSCIYKRELNNVGNIQK